MEDEEKKCQDEESGEFYFESDHLALKGNKDYTTLLKTIVILEAQRVQAIEDLDKLLSIRSKALKDPISFVAQIQNGELPELPGPQKVADIPYIDWTQYNIAIPDLRMRPQTRHGNVLPHIEIKAEQENGKVRYILCTHILRGLRIGKLRSWYEDAPSTKASQRRLISCGQWRSRGDSKNF